MKPTHSTYDVSKIRGDFPILQRQINDKPLVYFDNGASAQKPNAVLDAVMTAYREEYANVHRGLHTLSGIATDKYEAVRGTIAQFLNAGSEDEIIMNSGSTEGINMVAYSWAEPRLEEGDEIILTTMEHHANIVPWHFLREKKGVKLVWIDCDKSGHIDPQKVIDAITPNTKLIAVTHVSNVLGSVVDVKSICAHSGEVPVLVDGSQGAVHMPVDVTEIGCDFYTITGHKLYGPTSSGAIYVREDRMKEMQPFMGGGDMIVKVTKDTVTYNNPPLKFEAGTPGIVETIGLGAALNYLMDIGMQNLMEHETALRDYMSQKLSELEWLSVLGTTPDKAAIFSFVLDCGAPSDVGELLDRRGIAVRCGNHCAGPLMGHFGCVSGTCRASLAMYNTFEEIDVFIDALEWVRDFLYFASGNNPDPRFCAGRA